MDQALYLKYRPQRFTDLDVVEVRDFFVGLLAFGKIPHAFLFTGPRGIGKTSAARILAKVVNCEKNRKAIRSGGGLEEPCGECDACRAIDNGSAMDVIEIDAASNRGIDDVRELREKIKLSPVALPFKVYIVDECHMLTTEASNALLKTLEEPPAHAIFVLCTTEAHKVIGTIVSRATRVIFRRANSKEVVGKLAKVVKSEKIKISEEALEQIARDAGGSFRDAVKVLEQLAVFGPDLDDTHVAKFLSRQEEGEPVRLIQHLVARDLERAMAEVEAVVEAGISARVFLERGLEELRKAILAKSGIPGVQEAKELKGAGTSDLLGLARVFDQAGRELKDAIIVSLPLELMVVEWCGAGVGESKESKSKKDQQTNTNDTPNPANSTNDAREIDLAGGPDSSGQSVPSDSSAKISIGEVETRWKEILQAIRPKNHSVEALLRSSRPLEVRGNNLELEVFYKFHKERLETDKCRRIIEESIESLLGVPMRITYRLGTGPQRLMKPDTAIEENISGKQIDDEILKAAEEIFGVEAI